MKSDIDYICEMDIKWLLDNGWTIQGNIAYRRILENYKNGFCSEERIQQIIMQYQLPQDQIEKILQGLNELNELKNIFSKIV